MTGIEFPHAPVLETRPSTVVSNGERHTVHRTSCSCGWAGRWLSLRELTIADFDDHLIQVRDEASELAVTAEAMRRAVGAILLGRLASGQATPQGDPEGPEEAAEPPCCALCAEYNTNGCPGGNSVYCRDR